MIWPWSAIFQRTPIASFDYAMSLRSNRLANWLARLPRPALAFYATATAFTAYFCMYAYRKPFAAGMYKGLTLWGTSIDLKTALVVGQIAGYALSKAVGIKVCSEATRGRRAAMLVGSVLLAEVALLLFAIVPKDWKVVAIFLNGLPLGMVWGLVVWYLEGRKTSELLLAGLSCSFILASGVVKDVGRLLMSNFQVPEFWMPVTTGALFLPLFLFAAWLLDHVPDPTLEDEQARTHREPMEHADRWSFIKHFLPGMVMLLVVVFMLLAYRDFRDNFGVEVFAELGYGAEEFALFTRSELWVAFGVMGALAALNLIQDNKWGLFGAFCIMAGGALLMGAATLMHDAQWISSFAWMILVGLGSYLAYVPYGSVLFDRLIASTRVVGTAVFAIYVADFVGYLGSITMLLTKDLAAANVSKYEFLRWATYGVSGLGAALLLLSCAYFLLGHRHDGRAD